MDPNQPNSGNSPDPKINIVPDIAPTPVNQNDTPSLPWMPNTYPSSNPAPQASTEAVKPIPSFTTPSHTYPGATVINQPGHNPPPPPPVSDDFDPPVTITPPPTGRFPLMIVTTLIILTITGFSGSYIYFRSYGKTTQNRIIAPQITPPVTISEKPESGRNEEKNPFETESPENPFSNETSFTNPFGEDETDLTNAPYENPFDSPAGGTPTP